MKTIVENAGVGINQTVKRISKGTIASFIITLILLFIFSIFLTYTSLSEATITPIVIAVTTISILIGSGIGTIKLNKNGIINGGAIGFIYIFLLYLLSSIVRTGFAFNLSSALMILFSIVCRSSGRNYRSE